ncbi:TVP38/TMEM64 family protein [Sulfitobacter guttiformis]|uniref:TVP38/TMEM64 family membrane protein n=1 Tax=Sulfitobacter guttiformis TaxID=74349 RepID=A0A420DUA6_9RHOB|nr:VTT domain-containing protein [Sulfitobacter guttiformis]KIN71466.1 SNARE associated Golgi protein [Sulfitobacter guttiformis KCTC 32187]RKE97904.1 putative membrane protein YdjX (TVP38/TMEM64 family) [Sulfitobacter guttiformis]
MSLRAAILAGLAILGIALFGVWQFAPSLFTEARGLLDAERLEMLVARAGIWGPVVIVALMTVAVVASPVPSAPIALAAGAAYGNIWGTVQVVIGAELGALIAFGLARILGHDVLRRVFGDRVDAGLLGSQTALTATVLASRLMPFVSFDIISYAAGLSKINSWRFALATLVGIIPASFLLAHFGSEAVSGDLGRATWAVLGLGLVTGLPLLWVALRKQPEKGTPDHQRK